MAVERTERIEQRTASSLDTEKFAASLAARLANGATVCLSGPLGSGKSVFARGLCRGLGIDESVLSPSFILFEEYEGGKRPVVHTDLYRLEHEQEIADLGIFDRMGDGTVVVIEWGERSEQVMNVADVVVTLEVAGETERAILVEYAPGVLSA